MNEKVNNVLLLRDKFMPEMHLKQPRFTYCACVHLLKTQKEMKNYANRKYRLYLQRWSW